MEAGKVLLPCSGIVGDFFDSRLAFALFAGREKRRRVGGARELALVGGHDGCWAWVASFDSLCEELHIEDHVSTSRDLAAPLVSIQLFLHFCRSSLKP